MKTLVENSESGLTAMRQRRTADHNRHIIGVVLNGVRVKIGYKAEFLL